MKFWKRVPLLIALLQVGGVQGVEAQVFDWINKMTGIRMTRIGIQQVFELESESVRGISVTAFHGWKSGDGDSPAAEGLSIKNQGLQVAYETALIGSGLKEDHNLIGQFGVTVHTFHGPDIDNFVTGSFPILFLWRFPIGSGGKHGVRLGTGFNVFWFPDDAPPVTTETAGFEAAWTLQVGVDIDVI